MPEALVFTEAEQRFVVQPTHHLDLDAIDGRKLATLLNQAQRVSRLLGTRKVGFQVGVFGLRPHMALRDPLVKSLRERPFVRHVRGAAFHAEHGI